MKLFRSKSIRSTGPKVKRATCSEGIEKKDGEDKKSADAHDNSSDDSAGKRPSSSKAIAAAREEGEKQKKRKRKQEDHQVNNSNNNKAATAGDGSKKRSRTKANKKHKTTVPLILFTYSPPIPLQNILFAALLIHGRVSVVLGHTVSWKMTWHIVFRRFRMPLSEPIAERVAFNFASKALDGQVGVSGVQHHQQQHGLGLGAAVATTAGGHNTNNNSGGGGGPAISTVHSHPAARPPSQQQQQQGPASAKHHHQSRDIDKKTKNNNDDPSSSGHDIHILGVDKILEVLSQKNKTEMDKEKTAAAVVAATEKAAAEKETDAAYSQEQKQQQQETGTAAADGIAMNNEEPGLASGTRRRKRQGQTAPHTAGNGTTTSNTTTTTHYMTAPPLIPWPYRSPRSGYREFASANSYIRMQNDQLSHQVASLRSALIAADNRANAAEKELKDVLDYISSSGAINHIMSSLQQPQQQQQQRLAPPPPPPPLPPLQPQPLQFGHTPSLPHNNNNLRPGIMYGAPPPPPSGPPRGMPPFGVRPTMQLPGNLANRSDINGLIQAFLTGVNNQAMNNNNNVGNIRPQFQPAGLGQMAATSMKLNATNNNTMAQLPGIAANRVRSNNNIVTNSNKSNAARIGVGAAPTNTVANTAPSKITIPDSAPIGEVDRIHTQMNTIMQTLNSACTENDVDTSAARLTRLLEELSSIGSKLPDDLLTKDKKVCMVTVKAHLMRIFNKNIIKKTTSTGGGGGGGKSLAVAATAAQLNAGAGRSAEDVMP